MPHWLETLPLIGKTINCQLVGCGFGWMTGWGCVCVQVTRVVNSGMTLTTEEASIDERLM